MKEGRKATFSQIETARAKTTKNRANVAKLRCFARAWEATLDAPLSFARQRAWDIHHSVPRKTSLSYHFWHERDVGSRTSWASSTASISVPSRKPSSLQPNHWMDA